VALRFVRVRKGGGLAQLGEHLLCKQGVVGSIPSSSTTDNKSRSAKPSGVRGVRQDQQASAGAIPPRASRVGYWPVLPC
jgi:hypothetical protein